MRLTAAIHGNLNAFMAKEKAAAERAVTAGITEITNAIKQDLRSQVVGAGLGTRLSKTWQSKTYPRGQNSISAAGVVKSMAPKIIRAFDEGALIKASNKTFLAIPTANAPKRGLGNKRISPATYPESRFGKLRFVLVNSRLALLVSPATKRNKDGKVMFILVPQVQLKRRLDYMAVVDRWAPQLPGSILAHWPETNE